MSAENLARCTLAAVGGDRVRALQHVLYRTAKADPDRRFHALYDKVDRRDVLDRAWENVRRNRGAAGIDHVTLKQVEECGVDRLLDELATDVSLGALTNACGPSCRALVLSVNSYGHARVRVGMAQQRVVGGDPS